MGFFYVTAEVNAIVCCAKVTLCNESACPSKLRVCPRNSLITERVKSEVVILAARTYLSERGQWETLAGGI